MNVSICTDLVCTATGTAEVPVASWSEIKECYVKWDTLHYTLDGETWHEIELHSDAVDGIEWKNPGSFSVRDLDTDETVYDSNDE